MKENNAWFIYAIGVKKKTLCFPVNFAKFLRTPFLQNTPGRLLLKTLKPTFHT